MRTTFLESIDQVDAADWDRLLGDANPFTRHAFLDALEYSGSACAETGWTPMHVVVRGDDGLAAAMPLYLKQHSYGEFVFDWAWAQAYGDLGRDYYPKLVTAIPFTPSTGPRLGVAPGVDAGAAARVIVEAVLDMARQRGLSGWHLLFPDQASRQLLERAVGPHRLLVRRDVQFHWRNRGYGSFADFLAALKSSRRKNLRRERRLVAEQGVQLQRIDGVDITDADWRKFYFCYVSTYFKRSGHSGYLNRGFFDRLRADMPKQLMLVTARRDGDVVACALFLHDQHALYGRYWGALDRVHCLHFEACFYQGIEYCIERGLQVFDPGTQGEHKLLRGFAPVETHSRHWIADPRLRGGIAAYLEREREATSDYAKRARAFLPFRERDG